jgi:hypothetical protein
MECINTVKQLEKFGRIKLSKNFYMREFLYSEISHIHGLLNIPDDPDLAVAAGRQLCQQVLEPIQENLGRIHIRSAYRSCAVNAKGAENNNQYSCASNEKNYTGHIWDRKGKDGYMGATACIVVCSFVPYYERTGDWTALAWWIHDNVPAYEKMHFYPKLAAFNIRWSENPHFQKTIKTYVENPHTGDKKALTKTGMGNFEGPHEGFYGNYLKEIANV